MRYSVPSAWYCQAFQLHSPHSLIAQSLRRRLSALLYDWRLDLPLNEILHIQAKAI